MQGLVAVVCVENAGWWKMLNACVENAECSLAEMLPDVKLLHLTPNTLYQQNVR